MRENSIRTIEALASLGTLLRSSLRSRSIESRSAKFFFRKIKIFRE